MNIVIKYFNWHYIDRPKQIVSGIRDFVSFDVYFFSIKESIFSLFAPWRGVTWSTKPGFDPAAFVETLFSNAISCVLGFIMRSFLIIGFIVFLLLILIIGLIYFIFWLLLPILIILMILYGFYVF